jgi:hypothetical protein
MTCRFTCLPVALVVALAACQETSPAGPTSPVVVSPARVVFVTVSGAGTFHQRGQTQQLRAMATLSNGFLEDRTSAASWNSDNSGVASVSAAGVVTAGNEGEAGISATVEGQRGTAQVRVRYGNRTPDPPPGQRLPPPDGSDIVRQVFAERGDLVARSCQDEGGTWELLDEIVDRLRVRDLRWGYNGRRGVPSFPGRDEVAYHFGPGPSENSRDTYAWDVISGHCGPNPVPSWQDVTSLGTIWITRGRF